MGHGRCIPMHADLRAALRLHHRRVGKAVDGRVILSERGGPFIALRVVLAPHAALSSCQAHALAREGPTFLDKADTLRTTFATGMSARTLYRLTRHLAKSVALQMQCEMRVEGAGSERWTSDAILRIVDSALAAGAPVIIGLGHTHHHISVVIGASETGYELFDSSDLRWIARSSLGTRRSGRRHRLTRGDVLLVVCCGR